MQFNVPKNTEKYYWTQHSLFKLQQYGLSAQRIIRVINNPYRKQVGVAKNTIAVMQPTSTRRNEKGEKTWSSEIWTMYQIKNKHKKSEKHNENLNSLLGGLQTKQLKIISAWRYPGISPEDDPIPEEIMRELEDII
jgi:hypothetical protein